MSKACCQCEGDIPPKRFESLFCSKACKEEYAKDPPQTISCNFCTAQADGVKDAEAQGWKDIDMDVEGYTWNFLGTCPECVRAGRD